MDKSRNLFILTTIFVIASCGGGGGGGGSAPAILAKAAFVKPPIFRGPGSTHSPKKFTDFQIFASSFF